MYNHLEMEAALCVWEYLLENPSWWGYRDLVGTVELRHFSIRIGKYVLEVYDACGGSDVFDGLAYDWQVVPYIVDTIPFINNRPHIPHNPPIQRVRLWALSYPGFDNYLKRANHALKRKAHITFTDGAGLSPDEFRNHFWPPTMTADELAAWWVEKYDLRTA